MAENLVKFVSGVADDFKNITPDANTIYFITDGNEYKIYKGSVLYDGTNPSIVSDLSQLKTYIGTLPVAEEYSNLIDYIDKTVAAAKKAGEDAAKAVDDSLKPIAKSGNAADVAIEDKDNLITATTVEGALAEIATAVTNAKSAGKVTLESADGSGDTLKVYDLYQGVAEDDDDAAKAAKKIGTINIPKDYLVRSAEIKTIAEGEESPYEGGKTGDKYIDFVINTKDGEGTGTATHIYIALNDLVSVMQGSVGSEVTVTIGANNAIQAAINTVNGSKVIYTEADGEKPAVTVNAKIAALEAAVEAGFNDLDADLDAETDTSITDAEKVAVVTGIVQENGKIKSLDSIDVDKAGAASRAKAAVIGTASDDKDVDTIHGAKAFASDLVDGLNADKDATTEETDDEALAVMTGVTETSGKIASIDSAAADKFGAAARAKAAVIGTSADAKTADTVNGAKAYADAALADALTWGSLTASE